MGLIKNDVTSNNTIILSFEDKTPYLEGISDDNIKPGHHLELFPPAVADGLPIVKKFVSTHSTGTGGDVCQKIFAVENTRHGKTINTEYVANDRVMYRACRPGDVVLCYVYMSQYGPAINVGTFLCSSFDGSTANGSLMNVAHSVLVSIAPGGVVAVSLEAIDMPPSGSFTRLTKVQIV